MAKADKVSLIFLFLKYLPIAKDILKIIITPAIEATIMITVVVETVFYVC